MWTVHNSAAGAFLFAQRGLMEWDVIVPIGALIGVLGLGVWAIVKVKKWREETAEEVGPTTHEQLEHYQQMVDEGELDPEEFARIKAQLGKSGMSVPDPTPPADQPPDTSIRES